MIGKKNQEEVKIPHLRPEQLDTIRMEDLIKDYLTSKENVCTCSEISTTLFRVQRSSSPIARG